MFDMQQNLLVAGFTAAVTLDSEQVKSAIMGRSALGLSGEFMVYVL
jgi:hypothetical protein